MHLSLGEREVLLAPRHLYLYLYLYLPIHVYLYMYLHLYFHPWQTTEAHVWLQLQRQISVAITSLRKPDPENSPFAMRFDHMM